MTASNTTRRGLLLSDCLAAGWPALGRAQDAAKDCPNKAPQEPDLARRITEPGKVIGGGAPEDFTAFIAAQSQRWGQLVETRGIQPD